MTTNPPALGYLSHYSLHECIDEDGPIIRYLAKNKTGEDRIVKLLRWHGAPNAIGMVATTGSDQKKAFRREAKLLESLDYPGIVRFYDFWEDENVGSILVTAMPGMPLHMIVQRYGLFTIEDTLKLGIKICETLNHLQARISPILFGNVRPGSISFANDGSVVFIDFTNTRMYIATAPTAPKVETEYASPEQRLGRADLRTDLYSLGATLRYVRTGAGPQAPAMTTGLASFDYLIAQLLKENPDERPPTAKVVRKLLYDVYKEHVPTVQIPGDL